MKEIKDTVRSRVRIAFDGKVYKTFHGTNAAARFTNEVRILRHLEDRGCQFVPQLIASDPDKLEIVTTNCGQPVTQMSAHKQQEIYRALERFGVRHRDQFLRNITYCRHRNCFCVIDFELAEFVETVQGDS